MPMYEIPYTLVNIFPLAILILVVWYVLKE